MKNPKLEDFSNINYLWGPDTYILTDQSGETWYITGQHVELNYELNLHPFMGASDGKEGVLS